jgi:hypothetical protein
MRWNRNENREISQMEKRSNKKFRPHPAVILQSLNLRAENARRYSLLDLYITWRHGGIVHIRYWTLAETFLCFLIATFECAARREFPSVVHLTRHWGTFHSRYWTLANPFLFFTLPTCWNQPGAPAKWCCRHFSSPVLFLPEQKMSLSQLCVAALWRESEERNDRLSSVVRWQRSSSSSRLLLLPLDS